MMRIAEIRVTNVPPVKLFESSGLSDVVVLAGPNGVGKTRLIQAMIQFFQGPANSQTIRLKIEATSRVEQSVWGKAFLDTLQPGDTAKLTQTLQANRTRSSWKSSVIHFESDRTIQQIQPFAFTWDLGDPWEENIGWTTSFGGLRSRFQDTIHSIFRKVQSRRDQIGRAVEDALRTGPITVAPEQYPDPLIPFKNAFAQLLAPKELLEPDPKRQQLWYRIDGQDFSVDALSSGEREVVNIVFDFLLRNPEDCIVFFDEPELHLHPELSYKLLHTLRTVGIRNQFIFCTHSAEIITASLSHSVVFIAPPRQPPANQAIVVSEDDETNQALRLIGHSIGIVSLGKRLVLIEGESSSVDKQLYGEILKNRYPGLVLVPSGGKGILTSFATLNRAVLDKTIWGVEFFMLCDRDAVPLSRSVTDLEHEAKERLRVLPRYHIENYFLDANALSKVFEQMEPETSWLRSPSAIDSKLRELAAATLSYGVALAIAAEFRDRVGNLDVMPSGCHGQTVDALVALFVSEIRKERQRIQAVVDETEVVSRTRQLFAEFERSVASGNDRWKYIIPGKPILARFASAAKLDSARLKTMFIRVVEESLPATFEEIYQIFAKFEAPTSLA
jgi:ABC-type cobalamin/Fe3+-siderophores transport system ATPase subunit